MEGTLLSCQLSSIRSLKDGSVSLHLETPELTPMKAAELFALRNQIACVYISPKTISQKDMNQVSEIDPELPGKTPGQRLRASIYVWYQQDTQGYKDFDSFYRARMELFVDSIKANLV